MGQVSAKMRRAESGYLWFCPGCEVLHSLPDGWTFDGNLEAPTFSPSFKHEWGNGKCCHYGITKGQIQYFNDSTHALANQNVAMPDLPIEYSDEGGLD